MRDRYARGARLVLWRAARGDRRRRVVRVRGFDAASSPHDRRRVHAEARRGRALGARDDAVHDLVRGIVEDRAAGSRDPALVPRGHGRGVGAWAPRRRHRSRPASSTPSSMSGSSRTASGTARIHTKAELIAAIDKKLAVFPGHHVQLHAAGRGRGGRGGDGAQELARREGVRHRPRACSRRRGARSSACSSRCRGIDARHARAGARAAEPHDRQSIGRRSRGTASTSPTSTG